VFPCSARGHRHRACRGRRPDWRRRGPRAGGRWRDPQSGRSAPSAGRAGRRDDLVEHARLTDGLFDYRDLGAVALKGFAENVPAWQALGASAAESRFEALRATTTPLVGRGEEIALLLRRWEQAKGGEGHVVLVSGEPGIGKSRIAETILERLL
jgi:hypothetical protein